MTSDAWRLSKLQLQCHIQCGPVLSFQKNEPVGKCWVYWPFDQWFSESQRASFDHNHGSQRSKEPISEHTLKSPVLCQFFIKTSRFVENFRISKTQGWNQVFFFILKISKILELEVTTKWKNHQHGFYNHMMWFTALPLLWGLPTWSLEIICLSIPWTHS